VVSPAEVAEEVDDVRVDLHGLDEQRESVYVSGWICRSQLICLPCTPFEGLR
jgi:hypothetical protein